MWRNLRRFSHYLGSTMDDSSHPRSMLPQMQGTGLAGPSGAVLTASLLMLPVVLLKLRCLRLARWMSCRVPQGGLSVLSGSTRAGFSRSLLFCEGDRRNVSNPEFSAVFVFHEDALLGRILARKGARFGGDSKSEREMKTGHEGMTQLPASSFTHTLRTHARALVRRHTYTPRYHTGCHLLALYTVGCVSGSGSKQRI